MNAPASRILVCGSRQWPWPDTVTTVLNRLADHHPHDLVIIERAAVGAERAAHRWCQQRGLPTWRHRCYPAQNRRVPPTWNRTLPHRLLVDEEPRLIIVFHEDLDTWHGGAADLCRQAIATHIPVWHIPTDDAQRGGWLGDHPPRRRPPRKR